MNDRTVVIIVAISWIGILESIALLKGMDGTMFSAAVSAISGIMGYALAKKFERRKK